MRFGTGIAITREMVPSERQPLVVRLTEIVNHGWCLWGMGTWDLLLKG
jgi:hypothetical protein